MAITTKELIAHAEENIDVDARLANSHTRWLDYVNATIRDMGILSIMIMNRIVSET